MTLCLLDRLNFVDNFTGIHIDRERCLRPFPPIETRENGFLGVQPMYIVYGGQVCFVCGNRLVYRKKKRRKEWSRAGDLPSDVNSIRAALLGNTDFILSVCESFFARRCNTAATGALRVETDIEVQLVEYLVGSFE